MLLKKYLETEEISMLETQIEKPVVQSEFKSRLTGSEQDKEITKRKIRKDFYKIKQELGLINYMFDDLRYSNIDN